MTLQIYQPPEDGECVTSSTDVYVKPILRIFSEEEREEPVIVQFVTAQQRGAYQHQLYVSPWDPADTL